MQNTIGLCGGDETGACPLPACATAQSPMPAGFLCCLRTLRWPQSAEGQGAARGLQPLLGEHPRCSTTGPARRGSAGSSQQVPVARCPPSLVPAPIPLSVPILLPCERSHAVKQEVRLRFLSVAVKRLRSRKKASNQKRR